MPFCRRQFALVFLASSCFVGSQVSGQIALVQAQSSIQEPSTRTPVWGGYPEKPGGNSGYPTALKACQSYALYLRHRRSISDVKAVPINWNKYDAPIAVFCDYGNGNGDKPIGVSCGSWSWNSYLGDVNDKGICVNSSLIRKVIADNGGYIDKPLSGGASPAWYGLLGMLVAAGMIAASPPSIPNLPSNPNSPNDNAQAPGKPTSEDGYIPPKNWDGKKVKNPNGTGYGWPDRKGNVWVPTGPKGHRGPHWDVQFPKGGHINVAPGGKVL